MTKYKITQKDAKASNEVVLAVSYCFLQHVLNYESPVAYNEGKDGWNFDLYQLNNKYSIVTGYRGMSRASSHQVNDYLELKNKLEELDKYCVDNDLSREDRLVKLIELLDQYID